MQTSRKSITYFHNSWVFKTYEPMVKRDPEIYLLLHGWTGDENSMDIFRRSLPQNGWIIMPRAPFTGKEKGYSWTSRHPYLLESADEIFQIMDSLWNQLNSWKEILGITGNPMFNPIGFSQGGAMALILSFLFSTNVGATACLSGFLPDWAVELVKNYDLRTKRYLITHGLEDEIIPINRARAIRSLLTEQGANVNYCEAQTGHKLSADCFKRLEVFFATGW